jgi:hypothetical protein
MCSSGKEINFPSDKDRTLKAANQGVIGIGHWMYVRKRPTIIRSNSGVLITDDGSPGYDQGCDKQRG